MPAGCTKSARSRTTASGPNGTVSLETTSETSSKGPTDSSVPWPLACAGPRTFITPLDGNRKARSTLSPATTDSPCATWFPTTKRTIFSTAKTTTTAKITTFHGTAAVARRLTARLRTKTSSLYANDKCATFSARCFSLKAFR